NVGLTSIGPGIPTFSQSINFHRIDLRYQLPVGEGLLEVAATAGWDDIGASGQDQTAGRIRLGLIDNTLAVRSSISQRLAPSVELKVGADCIRRSSQLEGNSEPGDRIGVFPAQIQAPVANGYFTGLFTQLAWSPVKSLKLVPGVRFDTSHYIPDIHLPVFEPR